jgi:hypothetical protein
MAQDFRDRLREVVEVVFDGNVAAAAKAARMEPSTLHRIIHSRVGDPRLATARRLAESWGVPVSWLFGDVSAADAQRENPLPTPLWLIQSFFDRSQQRLRDSLRSTSPPNSAVADLSLFPRGRRADIAAVSSIIDTENPTSKDIDAVRRLAEAETMLLELAVQRLRREQREVRK